MKIYFARSINGLSEDEKPKWEAIYRNIAAGLVELGHELTDEFVVNIPTEAWQQTPTETYRKDIAAIEAADVLVAEVSDPSTGVGIEISYALSIGKPTICLYNSFEATRKVSSMVSGNCSDQSWFLRYESMEELLVSRQLPAILDAVRPDRAKVMLRAIGDELKKARAKHPKPINSLHEAHSVILEEFTEFWQEVMKQNDVRDATNMLNELIQTAAMCIRTAEDCGLMRGGL